MSKYATGKYAKAISDRSGLEFPYREMVREWNGSFVHVSEFEPKQPQLEPKPQSADGIALRHVRTARTENDVPYSIPENGFETYQAGSRVINVTAPGHGLTNGTTYRFRGAKQFHQELVVVELLEIIILQILMVLLELILQKQQDMQ